MVLRTLLGIETLEDVPEDEDEEAPLLLLLLVLISRLWSWLQLTQTTRQE